MFRLSNATDQPVQDRVGIPERPKFITVFLRPGNVHQLCRPSCCEATCLVFNTSHNKTHEVHQSSDRRLSVIRRLRGWIPLSVRICGPVDVISELFGRHSVVTRIIGA